jgi:phosphomannomutase
MKSLGNRYAKIFGAYDIRGVVGEDLDSPMVRAIVGAYGAYGDYLCPDQPGHFVVGHDARWSSPALAEAASVGLRESGRSNENVLKSEEVVWPAGKEKTP